MTTRLNVSSLEEIKARISPLSSFRMGKQRVMARNQAQHWDGYLGSWPSGKRGRP
jgi:hypothetical protein